MTIYVENNIASCSKRKNLDIYVCFVILTNKNYEELDNEDKKLISDIYGHFKKCCSCWDGYRKLKGIVSSDFGAIKSFPPSSFARLKQNEQHLEDILVQN